eukprot:TRINITY_DN4206_c0_g1_i2.p1 TRINITY_DN4206_c0_g1~~TRINITY_DN4206_c0_g1_i2.p1  ORF type:complete len:429 (+),score=83.33 TRINITY_DN4206_c0_g1_i2:37-1287(+)
MDVIVDDRKYDVSTWLDRHPGGREVIEPSLGSDISVMFKALHGEKAYKYLKALPSVPVENPEPKSQLHKDFEEFRAACIAEFADKPCTNWYIKEMTKCLLIGAAMWLSLIYIGSPILSGALCALFFQQSAFLGHDLGHNTVTLSNKYDYYVGLFFGNFCTGVSIEWWKLSHNVHHAYTNVAHIDPDIQHLPFFAISPVFFRSLTSVYHKTKMQFDGVAQCLVPYQAWLYYPIMAVARFNLYAQSYKTILTRPKPTQGIELLLLLAFAGWFSIAASFFDTWNDRFTFVLLSHALAGILHIQIVSSHFAMPALEEFTSKNFIEDQLATTIDITCPESMDWFHGGLQFQTVHHLMPRIPRPHLREAAQRMKAFCKAHGLNYRETTFVGSQRMVIDALDGTAKKCKDWSPIIFDAINLQG